MQLRKINFIKTKKRRLINSNLLSRHDLKKIEWQKLIAPVRKLSAVQLPSLRKIAFDLKFAKKIPVLLNKQVIKVPLKRFGNELLSIDFLRTGKEIKLIAFYGQKYINYSFGKQTPENKVKALVFTGLNQNKEPIFDDLGLFKSDKENLFYYRQVFDDALKRKGIASKALELTARMLAFENKNHSGKVRVETEKTSAFKFFLKQGFKPKAKFNFDLNKYNKEFLPEEVELARDYSFKSEYDNPFKFISFEAINPDKTKSRIIIDRQANKIIKTIKIN